MEGISVSSGSPVVGLVAPRVGVLLLCKDAGSSEVVDLVGEVVSGRLYAHPHVAKAVLLDRWFQLTRKGYEK